MKKRIAVLFLLLIGCHGQRETSKIMAFHDLSLKFLRAGDFNAFLEMTTNGWNSDKVYGPLDKAKEIAKWHEVKELFVQGFTAVKYPENPVNKEKLKYFLKTNGKYYQLVLDLNQISGDYFIKSHELRDLSQECDLFKNPIDNNDRAEISWFRLKNEPDLYSSKNLFLTIRNNSHYPITKIKYRLKMVQHGYEFYNKELVYQSRLDAIEVADSRINDESIYELKFDPLEGSFKIDIEILDVFPAPNKNSCLVIESIFN